MLSLEDIISIRERSLRKGFAEVSFAKTEDPSSDFKEYYQRYLKKKYHAQMKYLENIRSKFSLRSLWSFKQPPESMVIFLHPYRHFRSEYTLRRSKYKIARYAWGMDYHRHLKKKIKTILAHAANYRILVDSTPLPERYYARRADLGFIGKNGMLIHPRLGSYFFLSFALLSEKIPSEVLDQYNEKYKDVSLSKKFIDVKNDVQKWCAECDLCIRSCPTNALLGNGELDSNQCISYWTIESKAERILLKRNMGNWIFGCDICQMVCPYNKKSVFTLDNTFGSQLVTEKVARGDDIHHIDEDDLRNLPLERAGKKGLIRNIERVGGAAK